MVLNTPSLEFISLAVATVICIWYFIYQYHKIVFSIFFMGIIFSFAIYLNDTEKGWQILILLALVQALLIFVTAIFTPDNRNVGPFRGFSK